MSLEALRSLIPEEDEQPPQAIEPPKDSSMDRLNSLIPVDTSISRESTGQQEAVDTSTAVKIKSSRPSFQMVGSLAGGALGTPLGPMGIAAGGALGTMAGEFVYQTVEDIGRMSDVEGLGESPSFSTRITEGVKEGVIDLGFTVGAKAIGEIGKFGFKHLINKETQELIKEADRLGVEPNKMVIQNTKLQRFYGSVMSRFPFAAGKFRKRAKQAVGELTTAKDNLFMRMGPSWDMAKVGINLDDAYKNEYKVFREEINRQYTKVLDEARDVGAYVNTDAIKEATDNAVTQMRLGLQAQGIPDNEIVNALKSNDVLNRLRKYSGVKRTLSLDELRALDELLDGDMKFAASKGGEAIAQFGKIKDSFQSTRQTIRQLQAPPEGGKPIKDQLAEVDSRFTSTMTEMFETPVAKKLERTVNKNMFAVGKFTKAGTKNPDESFKLLWNAKSPKGMEDLHKVVGDKRFGASLRAHVEGVYDRAISNGVDSYMAGQNKLAFDFHGFKAKLGIGDPKSIEYKTMEKALDLSKSGITMKDVTAYTALLENALRNAPDDVNSFIARRATLGGGKAVLGALGGSLGAPILLLTRLGGRVLSSKPLLVRASMMLDPNLSLQHRKALMLSLEKMVGDE